MSIYNILLCTLLLSTTVVAADKNCVDCVSKEVIGMPVINAKLVAALKEKAGVESFADTAGYFCLKVTQIERNEVASFTKEMDNSAYPTDDYFQKPMCQPGAYGSDVKAPMLQIMADRPVTRDGFTEVIYKYYTIKRKDESLWLKAVNAKNEKGETFLDYIETKMKSGVYSNSEVLNTAINMRNFICSKGAVYSVYKDKKCP